MTAKDFVGLFAYVLMATAAALSGYNVATVLWGEVTIRTLAGLQCAILVLAFAIYFRTLIT